MMVGMLGDKIYPVHETHRFLQTRVDGNNPDLFLRPHLKPAHESFSASG